MSDFMYVVVGATAILVAGGILAGFAPQAPANGGAAATGEPLFFEELGTVGALQGVDSTSRIVNMGSFVVEETSPNATVYSQQEIAVSNSVFGSTEKTIEFNAFNPQKAYISFIQTTSTSPEHLIMTVNGEEVPVPDYATGRRVTIPIDKRYLQKGSNVVRLEVKDPGWAVWRSPDFTFRNLDITLNDLENARQIKPFRAYDYEVNGFDHGELTFFVTGETVRDEPLDIHLNGNLIAERLPVKRAAPYTINFFANTSGLRFGENVLSFHTGGDSYYPLSNVRVKLFYFAGNERRTVIRDFTISDGTYNALGKKKWQGRLSFDIERIFLERPLTIELANKTWRFTPTPGENVRTFDQEHVQQGQNTLQLTTDGSYRITKFNMSLAKTN